MLEKIKCFKYRDSTKKTYQMVWRKFNRFLMSLDFRPTMWEERASLFGAFLFEQGIQSATMKSYMSAIKVTLLDDGYNWNDDQVVLGSLVRACKMNNDHFSARMPIHKKLLEMLIFELECMFAAQPFLESLYKAFFLISYYGMFRVGELATSTHPV